MNGHNGDWWEPDPFIGIEGFDEALDRLTPEETDELLTLLQREATLPLWIPPEFEPEAPSVYLPEPELARSGGRELYEWIKALVSAVVFVGIISLFFARIIGVSGDSMNPTLKDGERLLVSNLFYHPRQGDIVIFAEKSYADRQGRLVDSEPLVKRIIAVGGQTVDIDFQAGQVKVDDQTLQEPYIRELTNRHGDMAFPLTVPNGRLFVMGDNRNGSLDSRFTMIGLVDERHVLGHVLLRVWPLGRSGTVDHPGSDLG